MSILLQKGRHVPIAIIWSTPHRYNHLIKHKLITFHSELMRPRNQVNGILVCKLLGDIRAKEEPCPTRR